MKYIKWLLIIAVVIGAIMYALQWNVKRITVNTYNRYVADAPYDVIIVPGLPYDTGKQNILLKVRMLWAKSLYDKGIAKNIIFSGGAVHSCWVEATIMKVIADSMGIPSDHTFAEVKAEHSNENVYYGYKLAQKLGFKKIALATDQFQNLFLLRFIKKKLHGMALLPVVVDSFPVYDKMELPHIDATCAYVDGFVPLNQRKSRYERYKEAMDDEVKE
ncbi:MAG TPA: YdcF family protein [Chitinophagales bacterium]|nr:YdcF family protein [Chitinophagales bacterium]